MISVKHTFKQQVFILLFLNYHKHFGYIVAVMCLANVYPNTGGDGDVALRGKGSIFPLQLIESGQLMSGIGKVVLKHFGFGA